jgi:hypothetical protein
MNDEHVLALLEAVHGADLDAIGVLAPDASFGHDISHVGTLDDGQRQQSITEFKSKISGGRALHGDKNNSPLL